MTGSEWAWNWVDSTAKLAYRIDAGETGVFGYNATIHHNVAIRALNGFQIKGFSQCALAAFSSLIHPWRARVLRPCAVSRGIAV